MMIPSTGFDSGYDQVTCCCEYGNEISITTTLVHVFWSSKQM